MSAAGRMDLPACLMNRVLFGRKPPSFTAEIAQAYEAVDRTAMILISRAPSCGTIRASFHGWRQMVFECNY